MTCYSLQNHLRTSVEGIGQIETDELYIGVDKSGAHYALPIQAKGKADRLGVTQVEQDIALCQVKFPHLICRPIGAQFMAHDRIALFEFAETSDGIRIKSEMHYQLVPAESINAQDLQNYRNRPTLDSD